MSEISVNSILDASGGATTTINGFTPTVSNMAGRNRIINGDMRIDQRNAGAAVTPSASTYTLDRWRFGFSSSQSMSLQQVTDAPAGFKNSILCTVITSGAATAGNLIYLHQNIEGFNVSDFGFGTSTAKSVTISFWVKSNVTGLKSVSLINGALNRAYCTTYNIDVANTWEYKTITMPGDTTGTWETGNGNGLELHFNFQVGSTYETTLGAWVSGRFYSASSVPDLTSTSGATWQITGVQLEAGSVATPFEHRQYGQELALCQRYYQISDGFMGGAANTTSFTSNINFVVTMRASPTVGQTAVLVVTDIANADFTQSSTNISITTGTRVTQNAVQFTSGNFSGMTTNRLTIAIPSTTGKVTLSAEL